jgi:hypothetical protein
VRERRTRGERGGDAGKKRREGLREERRRNERERGRGEGRYTVDTVIVHSRAISSCRLMRQGSAMHRKKLTRMYTYSWASNRGHAHWVFQNVLIFTVVSMSLYIYPLAAMGPKLCVHDKYYNFVCTAELSVKKKGENT